MESLKDVLRDIGIPSLYVFCVVVGVVILKEVYLLIRSARLKATELVQEKELRELDTRLEEFYVPLRERFQLTRLLKETTDSWMVDGRYQNKAVNIVSDDPQALRNLIVRKMFLAVNKNVEEIVLNKKHWKHTDDQTDYDGILQHFLLWKTFEDAKANGEIEDYEASHILSFPSKEIEKQKAMCDWLLSERERIRKNIKNFRKPWKG